MAKDIQKQLEELTATVAVLANVVGNLMTVTPELTAPATTPKGGRKAAPKGKAAPKVRIVRSKNIAAFGETAGYDLEGWTLQELLDAINDGGVEGFEMPSGWAFGPAAENYLATGEWS